MKTFVTGGTGFIGQHLVRKLLANGDEVTVLVRSQADAAAQQAAGTHPVFGDITDKESMRAAMQGSDRVFHLAAWYKLGAANQEMAETINVQGTRNVLELAYELGVPRIFYTSTLAVFGDTHGKLVDESYRKPGPPFLTEYDRTKWMAHYQVALPLIERGAPITILMPGAVYGPGDTSLVGDLMRAFYMGLFPVLPGPELTLTYVHVEDVAQGHLLAAERGKPGEAYILTGPALSLHDAVHLLASVSGRAAPLFDVPARWLQPLAPVMGFLSGTLPIPPLMSQDTLQMLGATYIARADKARRELGWKARPVEEGFGETMDWIAGTTRPVLSGTTPRQQVAALSVGAALGLLLVWMAARRRR